MKNKNYLTFLSKIALLGLIVSILFTICSCTGKHIHDYEAISNSASCTGYGTIVYKCSCGATYEEESRPLGHTYEITDEKRATCTEDGRRSYICTVCGEEEEESLKSTGHILNKSGVCSLCGKEINKEKLIELCKSKIEDKITVDGYDITTSFSYDKKADLFTMHIRMEKETGAYDIYQAISYSFDFHNFNNGSGILGQHVWYIGWDTKDTSCNFKFANGKLDPSSLSSTAIDLINNLYSTMIDLMLVNEPQVLALIPTD